MGKGKRTTTSSRAFTPTGNKNVKNTVFYSEPTEELHKMPAIDSVENDLSPIDYKKKVIAKSKHIRNSTGNIELTRDVKSYSHNFAIERFKKLVNRFESETHISIAAWSKEEALVSLLSHIEKYNYLYFLPDDVKKFWTFKFEVPDILRIYLYKVFYPRVFECELEILPPNGRKTDLKGDFVSVNFENIYHEVEELVNIIAYDAIIIAIAKLCERYIASMHNYSEITIFVNNEDKIIEEEITDQISIIMDKDKYPDFRQRLLSYYIPSSIFLAKCLKIIYGVKDDEEKEKKLTKILTSSVFYTGSRGRAAIDSFSKHKNSYYIDVLKKQPSFCRLLNMYHINSKSRLYDLKILKNNCEFFPYMLSGIVTKHHISKMIIDNGKKFKNDDSLSNSTLSSITNNQNYVINNISLRDYEILDFLITRTAKTIEQYYLRDAKGNDITANRLCEIIDELNKEQYGKTMCDKVEYDDVEKVDSIDNMNYYEIMQYLHPTEDL